MDAEEFGALLQRSEGETIDYKSTGYFRDNTELIGTERSATQQFSEFLTDIPSTEERSRVLRRLSELYPDEPHVWAHLGRFHNLERHDFEGAVECEPPRVSGRLPLGGAVQVRAAVSRTSPTHYRPLP